MSRRERFVTRPGFERVERLEQALGDPANAASSLGFARAIEADEAERYPEAACRRLDELGVQAYYVPEALGGKFRSFQELGLVVRTLARRDLTMAIAHGKTFLGSVATWIAGDATQQRRLAEAVLGGSQVALALTEREHGSDLLNVATRAHAVAEGFSLTGSKWLVNNATRGSVLTVFARSAPEGGPRGFSLFVVYKSDLDRGSYEPLPKIKTHGIRGADISGIRFREARVPETAVLGGVGAGFEVVLKGLLVTRTAIASLSLGAGDTALRVVLDFARERRLRTRSVAEIPHARRVLTCAFADLLICDALAITAARSLHVLPEQVALFSATTKYFVPSAVEQVVQGLSVVLGARYYLREEHARGLFQKILRDNALVSLFDGSTVVNLSALAQQLPRLSRRRSRAAHAPAMSERRRALFALDAPLPAFDPSRIALISGGDDVLEGLRPCLRELETSEAPEVRASVLHSILSLGRELLCALDDQAEALARLSDRPGAGEHPEFFAIAQAYTSLFAGATALGFWVHNRASADAFFAGGEWLALALQRLLERAGRPTPALDESVYETLFARLLELHEANRSFSLLALPLASGPADFSEQSPSADQAAVVGRGVPPAYRPAATLEPKLGDPHVEDGPFSFARAVEHDEHETYPEEACAKLDHFGLARYYVPRRMGGELESYEEILALLRVVGRRDLTTAVTHAVTLPGASLVWFAGSDAQQRRLAEIILGGGRVAIAFHEKDHGSDLLSCELAAEPEGDGFRLNGEKWGISHGRRSTALVLLARTARAGGPRGFSLFLLDKSRIPQASISYLPRLRTHGARGQDIDGVRLTDCPVSRDALIGGEGEGLEIALKCSQITRTLALAPLLGAADTALRATVAHLLDRRLYGDTVVAIPAVRVALAGAFADLLAAECVAIAATRAVHSAPRRLSSWAAATKYFVTTHLERMLHELSVLMGSRFFLRHVHWHGIFQKILRDAPMIRVSHFGGAISLSHLAGQLPLLYKRQQTAPRSQLARCFRPLFRLEEPLPAVAADRIALATHGSDEMLGALAHGRELVAELGLDSGLDLGVKGRLLHSIDRLATELQRLKEFLASRTSGTAGGSQPAELLRAAKHHTVLHAAAAALLAWVYNRDELDPVLAEGAWLSLALERLAGDLSPALQPGGAADVPRVVEGMLELHRRGSLFSLVPLTLGEGGHPAGAEAR